MNDQKLENSFAAVKDDVEAFRSSMNEWIVFLDHSLRETRTQVRELERRLKAMETRQDRERFLL